MDPYKFWIGLISAIIFVPVIPIVYWYVDQYVPGLPPETALMAGAVPLGLVLIWAVSWWGA